jgi:trimethylamine--corrinoid protein Co-methyltransferase
MLDFENCQSLEKLVLDNEIAGMCSRMARGIQPRNDFPIVPLMREMLEESHLLISSHTLENMRSEHYFSGPVIDRLNHSRWVDEGSRTLGQRANETVNKLINAYSGPDLDKGTADELKSRMRHETGKHGMDRLPLDFA